MQQETMMTLDDFNKRIMRPTLIRAIESGKMDEIILEQDCFEIIVKDKELLKAAATRIMAIRNAQQT